LGYHIPGWRLLSLVVLLATGAIAAFAGARLIALWESLLARIRS
jgi:hypothetical protein